MFILVYHSYLYIIKINTLRVFGSLFLVTILFNTLFTVTNYSWLISESIKALGN